MKYYNPYNDKFYQVQVPQINEDYCGYAWIAVGPRLVMFVATNSRDQYTVEQDSNDNSGTSLEI